jgi:small subunit ribosomal protein S5
MTEQETQVQSTPAVAAKPAVDNRAPHHKRGGGGRRRETSNEDNSGIDTRPLTVRRVSRMYHGGRRMRFSAFVIAGDRTGKVGIGSGKGTDVSAAQRKATDKAKKSMAPVVIQGNTIPHAVEFKFKSSRVLLKPAAPGTGIVAGATVKAVVELAGIKDLLTKVHGSTNEVNTAYATVGALRNLRKNRL